MGPARADPSQTLLTATIVASDGSISQTPESVDAATLDSHPSQCPAYSGTRPFVENSSSGPRSPTLPQNVAGSGTWPLLSALECLPVPVGETQIASVVVFDGGSAEAPLSPADLVSPSDFQDPSEVPVVSYGQSTGEAEYDRPARNAGDEDAADSFQASSVDVWVYESNTFPVSISGSAQSVGAGASVTFSADTSSVSGDRLLYSWSFGGGADPSSQASPTVSFAQPGSYPVQLSVRDLSTGRTGVSDTPLTITVTGPSASTTSTGPAASPGPVSGNGSAGAGPVQSAQTTPTATATATPGHGQDSASTGATRSVPRHPTAPHARTAHAGAGPGNRSGVITSANPSGATATPAGLRAGSGRGGPRPVTRTGSTGPPARPSRQPSPAVGARVSGVLLGEPTPAAAARPGSTADGSPEATALGSVRTGSPWTGIGAGVAVVALLGLGVGFEVRGQRGFRRARTQIRHPTT